MKILFGNFYEITISGDAGLKRNWSSGFLRFSNSASHFYASLFSIFSYFLLVFLLFPPLFLFPFFFVLFTISFSFFFYFFASFSPLTSVSCLLLFCIFIFSFLLVSSCMCNHDSKVPKVQLLHFNQILEKMLYWSKVLAKTKCNKRSERIISRK